MLIDGQKWACEACIRGHRVSSCKHHDRPLIRIKRKGRPFATCSICHSTPCSAPTEHARQKREAELKHPSKVTQTRHIEFPAPGRQIFGQTRRDADATHGRLYPRHHNPNGFQPIAPRPNGKDSCGSSSARVSRSGSSASLSHTPVRTDSRRGSAGTGHWSGSEASGTESTGRTQSAMSVPVSGSISPTGSGGLSRSADNLALDPLLSRDIFDPAYNLLSTMSRASLVQNMPLVSPLESANPFDFPSNPSLALDDGALRYLEDMEVDVTEGITEEVFHVEDWSRYMWSAETGFEHLDTGYPPVSR
ncbi:hypothetical protein N7523_006346 [Penicillium sp. IBT 18751x]|nr:hypothetical protein N7523_006346 [Penicillium sp. IBT 18751x]